MTTTLQLYTRRIEHHDRILDALGGLPAPDQTPRGDNDPDDDPGAAGVPAVTP